MIHDILAAAEDVSIVKVIDTDSLFIHLGKHEDLKSRITGVEEYINQQMLNFMDMHNMNRTGMINMRLKNEFYLPRIIAYSKKRYIGVTYDFEKQKKKIEIRGIEGRRATTKYTLDIVDHLQKYVLQDEDTVDLKSIFYDVFKKIEASFCQFNIDYISMPINPPKNFTELKSVQSPARGMINFDIMVTEVFSKMYTKGLHIPIYIGEDVLATNQKLMKVCREVIKRYSKFSSIKLERKKKDTDESYLARYIKDLTIPEMMMNHSTIEEITALGIKINFVEILKTFFKKFISLFSPIFEYDPNFDFLAECEKTYTYVLSTYYDVQ
jgi:hypothetical protein